MKPLIFDIQRFSIHDGPGIRTVVFFKGCNLECPWCQNPESMALKPEIAYYPDNCMKNLDCMKVCEANAISVNGGLYIDRLKCTCCGKCEDVCVSDAIRIVGKEYSEDRVMQEILRDKDYYADSGGGVTFSGGEPTIHFDFLFRLLKLCKAQSIHTNIETNGYFSWDKFEWLLPYLDLIYFDLKILDQNKNKLLLSGDSSRIIGNAERLIQSHAPVEFRLPLIPGLTTDEVNLKTIVDLLKKYGIEKIHLLPYHNMGESKADKIESPLPGLNLNPLSTDELRGFQHFFEEENITTILYR
ncbi:MAG: glycyl-radical enzyme activating protein [Sphingobacteriales bacterium]|jgi:pyruvate formate lyase activating enzyme|nr:glycyl-radical enzyme activating protein [Sphingobacteriales bacterium]